jgi:hypothetical protein
VAGSFERWMGDEGGAERHQEKDTQFAHGRVVAAVRHSTAVVTR